MQDVLVELPAPIFVPRLEQTKPKGTKLAGSWLEHFSFIHDLIGQSRPQVLVDWGTDDLKSYFGACQSAIAHAVDCTCYAFRDASYPLHAEADATNRQFFSAISHIELATASEAQGRFADGTIDLLRLCSDNSYESLVRAFEGWYPKLRAGGLLLLPRIDLRDGWSTAWQFWVFLRERCGERFAFHHGAGLGVVRKAEHNAVSPKLCELLFTSSPEVQSQIRSHYLLCASYLERQFEAPADHLRDNEPLPDSTDVAALKLELVAAQTARSQLAAELAQVAMERNAAVREKRDSSALLRAQVAKLTAERNNAEFERGVLLGQLSELTQERDAAIHGRNIEAQRKQEEEKRREEQEQHRAEEARRRQEEEQRRQEAELRTKETESQAALKYQSLDRDAASWREERDRYKLLVESVERSASWRITKPLRDVMATARKIRRA